MQINIPTSVNDIILRLEERGFKAYIVGGCVRDSILNRIPKDWDITTNAKPEQVISMFNKTIPTGLKHGTVTVMIDDIGYEVTTFRTEDDYSDGRHPNNVKFVNCIEEDLARRDFTMNAMAYNNKVGLIDPFNGRDSIEGKYIKCVGNPYARFSEDALRMMRAIRFAAQLGFEIEQTTMCAIKGTCDRLKLVSIERFRDEFNKILLTDSDKIVTLNQTGLLDYFMPEIFTMMGFNQNNQYHSLNLLEHTLLATKVVENKLHLKLAMLLYDIGKTNTETKDTNGISHYYGHQKKSVEMADAILTRLKYDNSTKNKVLMLIEFHDCIIESKKSIKKMVNRIGEELVRDLICIKWADITAQNPIYIKQRISSLVNTTNTLNEILEQKECFLVKNLAVNGKDLLNLGIKQGESIGNILNELLEIVIDNESLNTKEYLISVVKNI